MQTLNGKVFFYNKISSVSFLFETISIVQAGGRFGMATFLSPTAGSKEALSALRKLMAVSGVNGYIVPTSDAHNSEYVRNCDKRRAYISGFTGSAGTAVITESSARLWTDGRYFLQASEELGPEWTLMKDRLKETPTIEAWLSKELEKDMRVGYDPNVVSVALERSWRKTLEGAGVNLSPIDQNLVDEVWATGAPPHRPNRSYTCRSSFLGRQRRRSCAT